MIHVTGDTHGDFQRVVRASKQVDEDDYIIIAGDFGCIWNNSPMEQYYLNLLNQLPANICFIDGNHENFNLINNFPVVSWHGGYTHMIRPRIMHLMRGQIYTIEGKTIFTFGGAQSHDIDDGILDPEERSFRIKKKRLDAEGKTRYRIKNKSWWEQEMPVESEYSEARKNLEGRSVDYIITHCGPRSIVKKGTGIDDDDKLTNFFEEINDKTSFKHWYFGHYHNDVKITDKHTLLYHNTINL